MPAVAATTAGATAVPAVSLPDTSTTPSPPTQSATASEPSAQEAATTPAASQDLGELWQQILASLELPSTRMLLSQQARLTRIDSHRAVVQVSGNWMGMVQSRAALLEKAISSAMGGNRQLVLENHGGAAPMAAMPSAPAPKPAPAPAAVPSNGAQLPSPPQSAAEVPNDAASPAPPSATAPAQPPPATAAPSMASGQTPSVQTGKATVSSQPTTAPSVRPEPSAMDEKVKRFADFFNGQVLDVDLNS